MSISERDFNAVATAPTPKKREAPFSLRLSFEEKAALKKMARDVPLGAYIKAVLFDEARTGVRRSKTPAHETGGLGRLMKRTEERPLKGKAERPCSNCGCPFQPTTLRIMLCYHCFKSG